MDRLDRHVGVPRMTDQATGLVAVLILVAVLVGAAIVLVAQDPDVLPLAPVLGRPRGSVGGLRAAETPSTGGPTMTDQAPVRRPAFVTQRDGSALRQLQLSDGLHCHGP